MQGIIYLTGGQLRRPGQHGMGLLKDGKRCGKGAGKGLQKAEKCFRLAWKKRFGNGVGVGTAKGKSGKALLWTAGKKFFFRVRNGRGGKCDISHILQRDVTVFFLSASQVGPYFNVALGRTNLRSRGRNALFPSELSICYEDDCRVNYHLDPNIPASDPALRSWHPRL